MKRPLPKGQLRTLLLGGIFPVLLFTVIENYLGIAWGLAAGMLFGVGEILWEHRMQGKVDALTWGGNGILLFLGGISLITQEGVWFKLQPAFIEGVMAGVLWVSVGVNRPLLLILVQKQGGLPQNLSTGLRPGLQECVQKAFRGLTLRLGIFFCLHGVLAVWAALNWSTTAWALLKGVGFTLSLVVYLVVESFVLRYRFASIP